MARRDVRVTAGELRLADQAAPVGADAFARAILRRYQGVCLSRPRLALVFRQGGPGVVMRPVYSRTQVYVAPRLTLSVLAWRLPGTATGVATAPQPGLRLERQVETQFVQRRLFQLAEPAQSDQLVRRLAAQGERSETRAAPPVARVTHRSAVTPPAAEERPPAPDIPRSSSRARPQAAHGGLHTTDPGVIDVTRLTDQVIQAIDRRIIAQRERLGRV